MFPRLYRQGEKVRMTFGGRTIDAIVILASENGKSLALEFDAMVRGYVGMLVVRWDDEAGAFQDLMHGDPVQLSARAACETFS